LESVRSDMDGLDDQALDLYVGHFDAREDALAWEVLVTAADARGASGHVWERLSDAAQAMGLDSEDAIYGPTVRLAMQHRTT